MSNVTDNLIKLANNLDSQQMLKIADKVDEINQNILSIKKAQYIGFQGYWMRNRRCWENCYREKRSRTNKPAQEVWAECHQEYLESLNKDESEWDKYADDESNQLIKNANKQTLNKEDEIFRQGVQDKQKQGSDLPTAVFATIDENMNRHFDEIIQEATNLASVAWELKNQGQTKLAKTASEATTSLVKEAQYRGGSWWNPANWKEKVEEGVQGFFSEGRLSNIAKRLERAQQAAQKALSYFPRNGKFRDQESYYSAVNAFNDVQQNMHRDLQEIRQMAEQGDNPAAMQIYSQYVLPAYQAMQQIDRPESFQPTLQRINQSLEQAINATNTYIQQSSDEVEQESYESSENQYSEQQEEQQEQEEEQEENQQEANEVMNFLQGLLERTQRASSNKTSISERQVQQLMDWIGKAYGMQPQSTTASSTKRYRRHKFASMSLDKNSKQWLSKIKRNFNNIH